MLLFFFKFQSIGQKLFHGKLRKSNVVPSQIDARNCLERLAGEWVLSRSGSGLTYQACGVDIDTADGLVGYIKKQASRTTRPGATSAVGGFGAIFDLQKEGRKSDTLLVSGTDGVGTKLLIAHAMGKHDTIGIDLVAMSVNDILCQGAEPLYFLDYFSTSHLDPAQFQDVIRGVAEGCYQAGCALTGGETAELPGVYPPKVFDLAGFAVGDVHPDKQLPRLDAIHPGDILVGFPSSGLHSNGFSLVRRLVETLELSYQGPAPFLPGDQCLGDVLLTPTRIYVKEVLPLVRQGWIKALAHITGGGLVNNIPRVLPSNVRAILDASKWNMHPVYPWIATQVICLNGEVWCRQGEPGGDAEDLQLEHRPGGRSEPCPREAPPGTLWPCVRGSSHWPTGGPLFFSGGCHCLQPQPQVSWACCLPGCQEESGCAHLWLCNSGCVSTGTNLQSLLDHTASPLSASTIVLVISNRAGVLGLERARQAGVPTVVVSHKDFSNREDFDMEMHRHLKAAGVELICLAGFMRILSAKFVQLWHGRLINIHPSLLPSFPGAHAHRDALAAGVHITGCTVHFVEVFWIVFDFYLLKKMDQRTCIKFCVKNEINCADAFRMLTVAYGEATLDQSNVYRWYKMFSEGREDVNDEERAGCPSTSTTDEKINEVEKMILANRRITVREVAEDLNISIGSCHSIFINDLGMRRVTAKFVPKLLNCDQKQHRMNIANEMLDSVHDDPNLLQRVITGDEAWVYGYDVETKAQSSQWKLPHEPRPKKARQVRSNGKVLLTVFFDCRGVVHHEFLPQGRTVNKEYYLQVMRNLREAICQKRPDLWKNKNWLLHHDNAPAHTSLLVRDFLAKNNTLMMPQPPYSPDLAPSIGGQWQDHSPGSCSHPDWRHRGHPPGAGEGVGASDLPPGSGTGGQRQGDCGRSVRDHLLLH
ncbi:GART, partial [Cordylochernes scorpioides]